MHRTLWLSLGAVALFSVLVWISYLIGRDDLYRLWLPQFIFEAFLTTLATIYIWRLAWHREHESWLLWLLATTSLLLALALLPATGLVLLAVLGIEVAGETEPVIGLGVLLLFTGIVTPIMAATLWWHRNRG